MSNEFLDYVEDILDGMGKAETLLHDVTYDQFESDFRINFAVVRALEIIGEAAKRIPETVRIQYSSIPWKKYGWDERQNYPRIRYGRFADRLGYSQARYPGNQTTGSADSGRF